MGPDNLTLLAPLARITSLGIESGAQKLNFVQPSRTTCKHMNGGWGLDISPLLTPLVRIASKG